MPSELSNLHVVNPAAEGLLSLAMLNHVAIEVAQGVASQVLDIRLPGASATSWRYKRLRRQCGSAFAGKSTTISHLAFVYGAELLRPLHAQMRGAAPAAVVIVLVESAADCNEAEDKLAMFGWSGSARIVTDRLRLQGEGEADQVWRIALYPDLAAEPVPSAPSIGLSYLGRSVEQEDLSFLRRLANVTGLPVVVIAEDSDLPEILALAPTVVGIRKRKDQWSEFFTRAALFLEERPQTPGTAYMSPLGRALQRDRPVLCVGEHPLLPGATSLPTEEALLAFLSELKSPDAYEALIRQSSESLSMGLGASWHIERLRRLAAKQARRSRRSRLSVSPFAVPGPNAPPLEIAALLAAHTPADAMRWLATGPTVKVFRQVLDQLAGNRQGMTVIALQFEMERLDGAARPAIREDLRFWLGYHAAEWLLQENLANSALALLRSLEQRIKDVQIQPGERLKLRRRLALALSQSGQQGDAERVLRQLTKENGESWWSRFQLARWIKYEHPFEALASLEGAVSMAKASRPAMLDAELADVLVRLGRTDEASALLRKALSQNGQERLLQLGLANVHRKRGDMRSWAETLSRLLQPTGAAVVSIDPGPDLPLLDRFGSLASPEPVAPGLSLVTVIMTAFNAQATIAAAMRSVLAQTHAQLRLVVVDDASTDGTLSIVRSIAEQDARVVILQQPRNEGTYSAKNRALSLVASDYYTFHDSDDWMHPCRIERHLSFMRDHPDIVCSYSSWIRLDPEGNVASAERQNPASSFFRRSLLDEVGAFDMVRVGADREFRDRLRRRYGEARVTILDDTLGIGLKAEGSLTTSGVTSFDRYNFNLQRLIYKESYWRWYLGLASVDKLSLAYPQHARAFPAPPEMALPDEPNPHPFTDRGDEPPPKDAIVVNWPINPAVVRNWGDKLNPELVTALSGRPTLNGLDPRRDPQAPLHFVIGSGLAFAQERSVVWGSGFIAGDRTLLERPAKICAVRGPLTHARLRQLDMPCPEVFGDPAVLYPLFYLPQVECRFDFGLIQHCRETGVIPLPILADGASVRLIDIRGGLHEVVDAILSCRHILSSSLHGIIAAHSYGVPASWVRFSDKPKGDGFKFKDYWASIGRPEVEPLEWDPTRPLLDDGRWSTPGNAVLDLYALLRACPFIDATRQEELIAHAKSVRVQTPPISILNCHAGVAREG